MQNTYTISVGTLEGNKAFVRITLRYILKKQAYSCGLHSPGSGHDTEAASSEHGNELKREKREANESRTHGALLVYTLSR
jgi:hypothetical protein